MNTNDTLNYARLIIGGISSSSGKTIIVTGIIGALRKRGFKIQPYKVGPDYIDTGYLKYVSGNNAFNLDFWLMGSENTKETFLKKSRNFDISIIEGAMGLFDGGIYSTAELAKFLNAPVILCINAENIGESVSAIAEGYKNFDKEVDIVGVVLTRISGEGHFKLLKNAIEKLSLIHI